MIVALTGATGIVGRFIAARLAASGHTLRAWRREQSDLTGLPAGIRWIDGGLGDADAARRLCDGADALVHAALDHAPGRYRGGEGDDLARFMRLNVEGSLVLLETAREAGLGRAIVLSSRAIFGAQPGPHDDDAPPAPDTAYGEAKVALEGFAQNFAEEGWPVASLRPTGIYGVIEPMHRSKWYDLVSRALRGETVAARAATEVHGRDVAEAVRLLLDAPGADIAGRGFNCSDLVVSTRELVAFVQAHTGVTGPLPEAAPPPPGIMSCGRLEALGLRFGGRSLLERDLAMLVDAVRAMHSTPSP